MKTLLAGFETSAHSLLDAVPSGTKVDRGALAINAAVASGTEDYLDEMQRLTLLSLIIRYRGDFNCTKGKTGGTFKK